MVSQWKITLVASLIASMIGTAASVTGITDFIWPAHPILASFIITVVALILLKQLLPKDV